MLYIYITYSTNASCVVHVYNKLYQSFMYCICTCIAYFTKVFTVMTSICDLFVGLSAVYKDNISAYNFLDIESLTTALSELSKLVTESAD